MILKQSTTVYTVKKVIQTLRRKEAELSVILLHLSRLSFDIFDELQTEPVTEMTATLIRNATNKANPLSIKKYLHASCNMNK